MFKRFRPPLINKNSPTPSKQPNSHNLVDPEPAAKRRRTDDEVTVSASGFVNSETRLATSSSVLSRASGPSKRPLSALANSMHGSSVGNTANAEQDDAISGVKYYNALWRKPTAKKNKTWDGDGILLLRGGYAYLQNICGKDMGRTMVNKDLEPGSALSIGGKQVEVESTMSLEEYKTLRPNADWASPGNPTSQTGEKGKNSYSHSASIIPPSKSSSVSNSGGRTKLDMNELKEAAKRKLNISAPQSAAVNSAFKAPMKDTTVLASYNPNGSMPTPRHDPNAPGAVVMKRPASVPSGKQVVDVVVDPFLTKHLREHQREGVKFLYECVMGMRPFNGEGAILADDMGLGKTLQTITLLWTLLKQNPIHGSQPVIKKALVVCPVTLIRNWKKEFKKWLGSDRLGVFVADEKRTRLTDFTMGRSYSVMIIGYERLRSVQDQLAKGSGIDIVIADEGHRLKTVQNKSAQAIQSLNTPRRVILSGTPIQNDLSEFFAMVDFVNPGILGTFKSFMKEFEAPMVQARQPGALKRVIERGKAQSEELAELTSQFILRRTADILAKHLPPKNEYILFCDPTMAQASVYRHVLASPLFQSVIGNSESALQLITILKKLCNSPSLLSPKITNDKNENSSTSALVSSLPPKIVRYLSASASGKIRALDQLLHNIHSMTSEKVVLVSNYTSTMNILANLLTSLALPFLRLDGSTPASKRQSLVDDFNRSPSSSCFAFLLSAKAGGTGLNLIGASRLILFDVDWNPATDLQAMARIHRDGQKRPCHIYRFLLKGGIEEKIWQRQVTKTGLASSVMDQKGGTAHFSSEDLKDLFRLDESSECQTHELLGCECGGTGKHNTAILQTTDSDNDDVDDESFDDDSDDETPKLMKASELKAASPRLLKRQLAQQRAKLRSLLQYSHIDTRILNPDKNTPETSSDVDSDAKLEIEKLIGDEILLYLLKQEGNRVSYLFKMNGFQGKNILSSVD
ncbi:helicase [Myotisia sp. PD_48]|nr:helicase [Myotisia sp. PD_48]